MRASCGILPRCPRWCSVGYRRRGDSDSRSAQTECGFDPRLRHHNSMRRVTMTMRLAQSASGAGLGVVLLGLAAPWLWAVASAAPAPPVAQRIPHPTTLHGEVRPDDYYWLREKTNPKVIQYLEAENAYTDSMTAGARGLREVLYQEMLGRIKQTDLSVPYRKGGFLYYTRTEEGKQYPFYCRCKGTMESPEQLLIDVNALAEGHRFMAVGNFEVSPDGSRLAYTMDSTGYRQYALVVK